MLNSVLFLDCCFILPIFSIVSLDRWSILWAKEFINSQNWLRILILRALFLWRFRLVHLPWWQGFFCYRFLFFSSGFSLLSLKIVTDFPHFFGAVLDINFQGYFSVPYFTFKRKYAFIQSIRTWITLLCKDFSVRYTLFSVIQTFFSHWRVRILRTSSILLTT